MRGAYGVEAADIFRRHGPGHRESHNLPHNQLRAMHAIEVCKTSELGGHRDKCDNEDCQHVRVSYNSCRNRHCPKCQTLRKEKWIWDRAADLLPIQYFHVVFTIPAELKPLVLSNQKVMYDLLFRSVSETLVELGNDPRRLGARIGFISILHTWGQNLMDHPHVHCIVTGGGLSPEEDKWVSCRKGFFIPVRVMSELFKGKFLDYLRQAYESNKLVFPGIISHLEQHNTFESFRRQFYHKKRVVYCKPPFNGAQGVLQYLGRYTHRVAISNHRILKLENDRVSLRWRDYADGDKNKIMTLDAGEFIRRMLLHVLPDRFVKIRHYGLLANKRRKHYIGLARFLLGSSMVETKARKPHETWQEWFRRVTGIDVTLCPVCKKGRMVTVEILYPSCNGPPQECRL
ncbi:MAG: IS91 family transposase [Nitrospiraceae bacterium]|nr:IS91 family transposase [Nitrospiraceae bacterium]